MLNACQAHQCGRSSQIKWPFKAAPASVLASRLWPRSWSRGPALPVVPGRRAPRGGGDGARQLCPSDDAGLRLVGSGEVATDWTVRMSSQARPHKAGPSWDTHQDACPGQGSRQQVAPGLFRLAGTERAQGGPPRRGPCSLGAMPPGAVCVQALPHPPRRRPESRLLCTAHGHMLTPELVRWGHHSHTSSPTFYSYKDSRACDAR